MTAAEKLRMEIAQEIPFSKDEFISKISRLIKAYGYASFICDKHIRETDVSPNGNTIRMAHEQIAIEKVNPLYAFKVATAYFRGQGLVPVFEDCHCRLIILRYGVG